jgi:hypothetical protein
MTLEKAIEELINSDKFREQAKNDARLRVYTGRYKSGALKDASARKLLTRFGYKITTSVISPFK